MSREARDELLDIFRRSLTQVQEVATPVPAPCQDMEPLILGHLAAMAAIGPRPTEDFDFEADRVTAVLKDMCDEDAPGIRNAMSSVGSDSLFNVRLMPAVLAALEVELEMARFDTFDLDEKREARRDPTVEASWSAAVVATRHPERGSWAATWWLSYLFLMQHRDGGGMTHEFLYGDEVEAEKA